jgi:parallel beta-helix repeat protein
MEVNFMLKPQSSLAMLLAVCLLTAAMAGAAPHVYHVAPDGNDAWTGTAPEAVPGTDTGPFASLQRARDAVRALPPEARAGGIVYVHAGVYYLQETLAFGPEDGGAENAPVIWQAWMDDEVHLIGGKKLEGFTPAEDGKMMVLDLSAPDAPRDFSQLFFNGVRQHPARWPDAGTGELPGGGWAVVAESVPEKEKSAFIYGTDRPAQWKETAGLQVSIWPNYNWWQTIAPVASLEPAQHRITLEKELPYTIEPGRRFFFRNIREELDAPGEWYLDRDAKKLYFIPPGELADATVTVPVIDTVIAVKAAANLNIIGFSVSVCRGNAVTINDSTNCLFAKSVIRNTGSFAVNVQGGKCVRVRGNDISNTGRGGIVLNGGDRKTLTGGGHEAVNNHIHHFGELYQTYQTAVNIGGVGNLAAHNLIHDAPHIGILLGGNNHIIEYNEIHHVCMEGSDNGGFYMGRDWTQRGNILRYNCFHDIYGFGLAGLRKGKDGKYHYESPHQAWGIYLDDCSSGTHIHGNLFYRVPLCGVMIGGGRDNIVENNIFVECIPALHIDDRWDAYCWDVMHERLEAMNYREPPYSEAYPELLEMGDDPRRPENNRFERNIVYYTHDDFRGLSTTAPHSEGAILYDFDQFHPESTVINHNLIWHAGQPVRIAWSEYQKAGGRKTITWEEWRQRGFDKDSIIADPGFVEPEKDDYHIRPDAMAAAKRIGFNPLPISAMGLMQTELRASWPPPEESRREGVQHREWAVEAAKPAQQKE